MLKDLISKNLRQPKGLLGRYVGLRLKSNLSVYNELEDIIDFNTIKFALEIGYGPGYGIKEYSSKYNCVIHGIDFSQTMFQAASRLNKKNISTGKVKLFYGNFNEYDDIRIKYDLIYLINVIYFWKEIESGITKINNVLDRNGQIVIFMDSPNMLDNNKLVSKKYFNLHQVDDVINTMNKCGFHEITIKEYSKYSGCYYLIGRKKI